MLLVIFSGLAVFLAKAEDYDQVILCGRVMDPESGLDAARNAEMKDGRIAAITIENIKREEMEKRTNWSDLLSADELEYPPAQDVDNLFNRSD